MQGGAAERPGRRSFAELLSAKLVKLETDFGLEPKFGLHVIAGQVAISLKSARAAFGAAPPHTASGTGSSISASAVAAAGAAAVPAAPATAFAPAAAAPARPAAVSPS